MSARGAAAGWLAACLLLAGCERPVPEAHRDYVGHWRGDSMLLVISEGGHGDYERVRDRERVSIEGPVHGFDDDGFRIGIGPLGADFVEYLAESKEMAGWTTLGGRDPVLWALEVLGLAPDAAGRQAVQHRFRELLRTAHPDHGGATAGAAQRISDLTEARRILLHS